ncbi:MAG: glutamine amidotransferase [Rhodobacteraceae bacterium]|jgi:GMP synthase (glutamine-hydrolysing)|nr:glutamine amidotransferase [Paracoccaceae bacterium]
MEKRRLVIVMHNDEPVSDRVQSYCVRNSIHPDIRKPFAGDTLGSPNESLVGTVILGGVQRVFDFEENPFLHEEYRWISECLEQGVPTLGICMGSQQLAYHLGAKIRIMDDNTCEFGYYEIFPTENGQEFLNQPLTVAHSHFEYFDMPEGVVHLASSALCTNQAFRYGDKVYGFQFHPERLIEGFELWQKMYGKERAGLPGVQSHKEQTRLMHLHDAAQGKWFDAFLEGFFGSVHD